MIVSKTTRYKYCKECKKVTKTKSVEGLNGDFCSECTDFDNLLKEDKNKDKSPYSFSFKVKKWRFRANASAYNRDKMKDLIQK